MRDAVRRGRHWGWVQNKASLTERQVSLIKYFLQLGWTCIQLAEQYRVSKGAISHIKNETRWSHVQPFQPIPGEPVPLPPGIKPTTPLVRRF
jgi:hypothetical protein